VEEVSDNSERVLEEAAEARWRHSCMHGQKYRHLCEMGGRLDSWSHGYTRVTGKAGWDERAAVTEAEQWPRTKQEQGSG
jgi:hypothetical protein